MKTDEHKMTQLGYALREYRVRHNMTQQELAEKLGVSTNTIHLWETKVCKPSMGSLLLLSDLFGNFTARHYFKGQKRLLNT